MEPILATQVLGGIRRYLRYVKPGRSIQSQINAAAAGTTIVIAPGEYEEAVVIPHTKRDLTLVGAGGRGAVAIQAPTNGVALTNHARDVSLFNIGMEGDGTGGGLLNTGRRLRAAGCKIEGGADAVILSLGSVAEIAAGTKDRGDDVLFEDCELCWSTNGLVLRGSDYGAVTQPTIRRSTFHNLTNHVTERLGTLAEAAVTYRDLEVADCHFRKAEDGANPTKFFDLNDDNTNTGVVRGCTFPVAANSGLSLVSTKVIWVNNYYPAGPSTGQPS